MCVSVCVSVDIILFYILRISLVFVIFFLRVVYDEFTFHCRVALSWSFRSHRVLDNVCVYVCAALVKVCLTARFAFFVHLFYFDFDLRLWSDEFKHIFRNN